MIKLRTLGWEIVLVIQVGPVEPQGAGKGRAWEKEAEGSFRPKRERPCDGSRVREGAVPLALKMQEGPLSQGMQDMQLYMLEQTRK